MKWITRCNIKVNASLIIIHQCKILLNLVILLSDFFSFWYYYFFALILIATYSSSVVLYWRKPVSNSSPADIYSIIISPPFLSVWDVMHENYGWNSCFDKVVLSHPISFRQEARALHLILIAAQPIHPLHMLTTNDLRWTQRMHT